MACKLNSITDCHKNLVNISVHIPDRGSIFRCFGSYFSEQLCSPGSQISVNSAEYGVSTCHQTPSECCANVENDCKIDVETQGNVYFQEILRKCNGRRMCQSLQANWIKALKECGVQNSDYMIIYYDCLSGE